MVKVEDLSDAEAKARLIEIASVVVDAQGKIFGYTEEEEIRLQKTPSQYACMCQMDAFGAISRLLC